MINAKKVGGALLCLMMCLGVSSVHGGILFSDDFEAYDPGDKTVFAINGVPSGNWTAHYTPSVARSNEIWDTRNFGGTRMWITIEDGAGIISRPIEGLKSGTEYLFSAVLVAETSVGSRTVEVSYDILIGPDAASAVSVINGPQTVLARGDGWQIPQSKADHVVTHSFTTGTLDDADRAFVRIKRIQSVDGAYLGVDDVVLSEVLPIDVVAHGDSLREGGGALSYDIFVRKNPTAPVSITVKTDNQLYVNGQSEITLVFEPPADPVVPQIVTITAVDDTIVEGLHEGQIFFTSASSLPAYDQLTLPTLRVVIEDNDWPVTGITDVFVGGQEGPQGTPNYRIPSLTVAPDGSVLAFAEGRRNSGDPGYPQPIDMVMKRSTNHGATFEPLVVLQHDSQFDFSDPRPLTDMVAGKVHLLYTQWPDLCGQGCVPAGLDETSSVLLLQTSDDNGKTWSGPINLNPQVKNPAWRALNSGPGHGIQLRWQTQSSRNGRLLIPAHVNGQYPISVFSDDAGQTWQAGELKTSFPPLNESDVVELTHGDLLWDARPNSGLYRVRLHSSDGGQTWTQQSTGDIYITPVDCGLERFSAKQDGDDRDRILFSGPLGEPIGTAGGRYNMAVWTSYDEGRSFINPVQIHRNFAAYSDLKRLADGSIGVLFEETGSTLVRLYKCSIDTLENGPHDPMLSQYDGFGNAADPRRGGVGWTGSWTGTGEFTRLWHPRFNSADIPFNGYRLTRQLGRVDSTAQGLSVQRRLANPITSNDTESLFISVLVSRALDQTPDRGPNDALAIELQDAQAAAIVSFGVSDSEQFFVAKSDEVAASASGIVEMDAVYWLIAKVELHDGQFKGACVKAIQAGVDAVPLSEAQVQWTVEGTFSDRSMAAIEQIALIGGPGAVWSLDELRIGTTYESVVGKPSCEDPQTYLVGDLNRDCYVTFEDFALLAKDWLRCTDPGDPIRCR